MFDSSTTTFKGSTLNLEKIKIEPLQCNYWQQEVQTYLYSKYSSDSLLVFLDFYSKRLIRFSVYFNSDSLSADVERRLVNYFGKYERKLSNKKISAYFSPNKNPFYSLAVSDAQAMKFMPSWCGNCNRSQRKTKSWTKLGKYVNQN